MNKSKLSWGLGIVLMLSTATAISGVLDPDCTAEKAAKSTAMKATVAMLARHD